MTIVLRPASDFLSPGRLLPLWNIVKSDQINVVSFAMFCDFEQIKYSQKARFARQFRSDVRKCDGCNRLDLDFPVSHAITPSFCDVGPSPNPNAARYISSHHSFAESLRKHHAVSLPPSEGDASLLNAAELRKKEREVLRYKSKTTADSSSLLFAAR
jgi:hypothetical protein